MLTADCDDLAPPEFTSHGSSTRRSHKKDISRFQVQTEISSSSIFLFPPRGEKTLSKMKKLEDQEDTLFEEDNGKHVWSTSSDLLHMSPSRSTSNEAVRPG